MNSFASLGRLVFLSLLWGSSFLWIKVALGGFSPLQLTFTRLLLGGIVLYAIVRSRRHTLPHGKALWLRLLIPAILGNAIPFSLFAWAEQSVDSGVAGVLNSTTPLWALVIGLLIGSERLSNVTKTSGLLLGFVGVVVIFAPWHTGGVAIWGTIACLVAAASYAVSYTYIAKCLSSKVSPLVIATSQIGMATVLTGAALPLTGSLEWHVTWPSAIAVTILGILGTGIAFAVNNKIIAEEGATAAASVGYLLPVTSVLLGAIFLHEPLTWRVIGGMAIVLVGIVLTRWRRRERSTTPVVDVTVAPEMTPTR